MSDSIKKDEVVGGINPVLAAVVGVVAGAGAVVAGAMMTKDNNKVEEKVKDVVEELKGAVVGSVDMAKEKIDDGRAGLKKVIDEATDLLRNEASKAKKEVKKVWQK